MATGASVERAELLRAARELIELDRCFGVEFVPRAAVAAEPAAVAVAAAAAPVARATPVVRAAPVATAAPAATPAPVASPVPAAAPSVVREPPRPRPVVAAAPVARTALAVPEPSPAGDSIAAIATAVAACRACGLCGTRTKVVPGEGLESPELLFVGEGPGADEDLAGRPFVGAAGQLLDKMIVAMGFSRAQVFIANVVKCRPPGNRNPEPEEIAACLPFLHRQIAALKPKVICTLGNVPLRALFGADQPGITKARGQWLDWHGIPVLPTFHPSYLLRTEQAKKPAWEDLLAVLKRLGREAPKRAR